MPSQRLETELLQDIIEKLAEGPREEWLPALITCARAHSAFTDASQKRIFEEVTLYSHPSGTYEGAQPPVLGIRTPEGDAIFERTRQFAIAVEGNAKLASYVKKLTYRFNQGSLHNSRFLLNAIRRMTSVVELTVGVYTLQADRGITGLGIDGDTVSAIVTLMEQPHLKAIRFEGVLGFLLESMRASPGLRTLSLKEFAHSPGEFGLPSEKLLKTANLETLICDGISMQDGINFCLSRNPTSGTRSILSRVQNVELILSEWDITEDSLHVPFLRQAECLKRFK
ncbi:hypothetical protein NMY22_g16325 [Coprinellus aureogranulatus]|nr:hypothetical protein NMY22_g16325 [Coprinellus aureogranulatus]